MGAAGTPTYKPLGAAGSGGGTCANSPELLCLAGRTGTTNDPTISSDGTGSVYGSAADTNLGGSVFPCLDLNAHTGTTLNLNAIRLDNNTTTISGVGFLLDFSQNVSLVSDAGLGVGPAFGAMHIGNIFGGAIGPFGAGVWTVTDDTLGGLAAFVLVYAPTITNPTGVGKKLIDDLEIFVNKVNIQADSAACTFDHHDGFFLSAPQLITTGGGTLTGPGHTHFLATTHVSGVASDITLSEGVRGYHYDGLLRTASTVTNNGYDIAFSCVDSPSPPAGDNASLKSQGSARVLMHAGAGVYGAAANPTNTSVGLEVQSTTLALLVSRLTTTQKNALTPLNGMIVYDTTLGKFQGYEAGAWTNFI